MRSADLQTSEAARDLRSALAHRGWTPEQIFRLAWRMGVGSPRTAEYAVTLDELANSLAAILDRITGEG